MPRSGSSRGTGIASERTSSLRRHRTVTFGGGLERMSLDSEAEEKERRATWEMNMMSDVAANREMLLEMRRDLDRLVSELLPPEQ